MLAIDRAREMHERIGLNFTEILCWYLKHGFVVSMPDRFIMAKEINTAVGAEDWHPANPDAYFVFCAVGEGCLEWFLDAAPKPLHSVAWCRIGAKDSNKLRIYETSKIRKLLKRHGFVS